MQSRQNLIPVSRYFSLTIPASQPNRKRKSHSRSLSKLPLPAPFLSSHPEYHHKKQKYEVFTVHFLLGKRGLLVTFSRTSLHFFYESTRRLLEIDSMKLHKSLKTLLILVSKIQQSICHVTKSYVHHCIQILFQVTRFSRSRPKYPLPLRSLATQVMFSN